LVFIRVNPSHAYRSQLESERVAAGPFNFVIWPEFPEALRR
jgi:hypothetical protein